MKRSLAYYGDPFLRRKAKPVEAVDDELRQLVSDMFETMDACNGSGLAAVQICEDKRLFVMRIDYYNEQGELIRGKPCVFINPTLSDPSDETVTLEEGCLSIPGIRGAIKRPEEITIEATDLEGNRQTYRFKGWEARCCMHENDHINGVLMIDRFDPKHRTAVDPKLRALKKKYKS